MSRLSSQDSNKSQQEWSSTTNNRNFSKKFVPKIQNPNPNPNPKLSDSLRQSLLKQQDAVTPSLSGNIGIASSSRVRMGDNHFAGNFVNYLPQDEEVAAGLGAEEGGLDPVESQRVMDLLNKELSWLLRLRPKEFWREVASDTSLHEFLDSFLKFRSRWFDFPHRGAKGIVAGVIVGELELSRRVFMVLYRISSNRDPGARAADTLVQEIMQFFCRKKSCLTCLSCWIYVPYLGMKMKN